MHKFLSKNDNLQHLENQTAQAALDWSHGCQSPTPASILTAWLRWFCDQWTVQTLWGWKRVLWYVPILAWVLQLPSRRERKRNSFDSHLLKHTSRRTSASNVSCQYGFSETLLLRLRERCSCRWGRYWWQHKCSLCCTELWGWAPWWHK